MDMACYYLRGDSMSAWRLIESAWTLAIIAVLVMVAYALTGCTEVQCVKPIVQIERPVLPEASAGEFRCIDAGKCEQIQITFDVFRRLRERDLLLHQYAETLEMTIRELAEVPE
jgi:hypothetical protein